MMRIAKHFAVITAALVVLGSVAHAKPKSLAGATDEQGKPFSPASVKTPLIVVTFGASWCKPCKSELPVWDSLAKRYKGKVTFIAVNADEEAGAGRKFMKGLKLSHMITLFDRTHKVIGSFEPPTMPTTYVLDNKWNVLHVHKGYHKGDGKKLMAALDAKLKGKSAK